MKTVAFDIGNVLGRVNLGHFRDLLTSLFANDGQEFLDFLQGVHDVGMCSIRQGLKFFTPNHRIYPSDVYSDMEKAWFDALDMSEPMLNLIEDLLDDDWRVSLLSNMGTDHAVYLRREYPVINRCVQHFSCEVGARKPTKLFYQSFVQSEGWRGIWRYNQGKGAKIENYTLFFDDLEENVIAAGDYFRGVQFSLRYFDDDKDAVEAMRKFLADPSEDPPWKDICTG